MLKRMTLISSVMVGCCLLLGIAQAKPESTLRFLLQTSNTPILYMDQWQALAQTFAETDSSVDAIEFVTDYANSDPAEGMRDVDCAYTFINHVPFMDLSLVQPLDAFIQADPDFAHSDVPEAFWALVTRNEQIYGLPLTVNPLMMWYSPQAFSEANTPVPTGEWTADEFLTTLTTVRAGRAGFAYQSRNPGIDAYVLLAAGLGGQAIDYSTYIPTYHLTDPQVVEALRRVLVQAKTGVIHYTILDHVETLGIGSYEQVLDEHVALYDTSGWLANFNPSAVTPVVFPRGKDVIPMSYSPGAAYIMADTPHADSCYQWLRLVSQHPELFRDMPAHQSQISNPALIAEHGQAAVDVYAQIFAQIDDSAAVFMPVGVPTPQKSPMSWMLELWLAQAVDNYILKGIELEISLQAAQTRIDIYSACLASLPSTAATAPIEDIITQAKPCLLEADPALFERFYPDEK